MLSKEQKFLNPVEYTPKKCLLFMKEKHFSVNFIIFSKEHTFSVLHLPKYKTSLNLKYAEIIELKLEMQFGGDSPAITSQYTII